MGGATNCPETPRQKMIGMMYLVLTAMLALNVSAAILNGYTQVDESLHATIDTMQDSNAETYATFKAALDKNPEKTQEWYDKALEVKRVSDEFFEYVQLFKDEMVLLADGKNAKKDAKVSEIGKKDDTNIPSQYAISEGNATILKEKINRFRNFLIKFTEDVPGATMFHEEMNRTFVTEDGKNAEGDPVTWENMIFNEMPMCASITILTKLQNDIRHCEGVAVRLLLGATDAGDLRVNKFNAYVIPSANYVVKGTKYTAQVILAAIDSTQTPEYYVNGQKLNNKGIYEVVANNVGVQKITGKIGYMDQQGVMQYLPFEREYTVGEPTATISNTDLNIMYRGYDNPFSISVPGVSAHLLQVNCAQATITQKDGMWIIRPNANSPENLNIEVFANIGGSQALMGSHTYRVKNLPRPDAYFEINGVPTEDTRVPRAQLVNPQNKIVASYGADGLVQAKFEITGFQVKLPTGASISVKGDRFDDKALAAIKKLKQGNTVNLMYIKAKGPDGKEIQLRGLPIELN
jgi:gliding motility-associated protein GldM